MLTPVGVSCSLISSTVMHPAHRLRCAAPLGGSEKIQDNCTGVKRCQTYGYTFPVDPPTAAAYTLNRPSLPMGSASYRALSYNAVGHCVMAAQQSLELLVQVRILVPQPLGNSQYSTRSGRRLQGVAPTCAVLDRTPIVLLISECTGAPDFLSSHLCL